MSKKALVLIDIQNDFMPTGALPVPNSDEIIPGINAILKNYEIVVATQDWHTENHISFACSHHGKKPFDTIFIGEIKQELWEKHCVQGTFGADFPDGLETQYISAIFRKGTHPKIDSYSAFYDNSKQNVTGLAGFLREKDVTELHFVGIAADVCVYASVRDALDLGFKVKIIERGVRALSEENFEAQKRELFCNDDFGIISL